MKADSFLAIRERQKKRAACAWRGFGPGPPAVFLHHHLHDRQSDASAFIVGRLVQPFEEAEDFRAILGAEANPVVADPDDPFRCGLCAADADIRRRGGSGKLGRIVEQVDQGLTDADRLTLEIGEGQVRMNCRFWTVHTAELIDDEAADHFQHVEAGSRQILLFQSGILQERIDHRGEPEC